MKICTKCLKPQDFKEFAKNIRMKDGLQYVCKSCSKIYMADFYQKNRNQQIKESTINKKTRKTRKLLICYYLLLNASSRSNGAVSSATSGIRAKADRYI